jgi:pimeloyl-ACP methyl ester carboxylesterase
VNIRHCVSIFLAAWPLAVGAPVAGAEATGGCVDRLSEAEAAVIGGRQLAELRYECVVLDGGRSLWVGEAGSPDGDAVLLVHGLGDNAHRDWRNAIPQLATRFRVIAIDLPGFGASEALPGRYTFDALAATLEEILRRRQIERTHVVGHSLGGALSLYFAAQFPQRVERLVLVDAAGVLQESVFVRHIAQLDTSAPSGNRLASAVKSRINNLSRHLLRKAEGKLDFSAWLATNPTIRAALLGNHPQVEAAISLAQQNFAPAIRSTRAPTTLIWGRDDPVAPLRTGMLLAARMPDARLQVLDKAGHVPMTSAPTSFNELLMQALVAPLAPHLPMTTEAESFGDVVCKGKANARYSGHFKSLRLANCANVRIEAATLGRLQIDKSTAELYNVTVTSADTALIVRGSTVVGTALQLQGAVAIKADDSELDLAGVSLQASRQALNLSSSARIYFSVSDIRSPDFTGGAHGIWTRATRK